MYLWIKLLVTLLMANGLAVLLLLDRNYNSVQSYHLHLLEKWALRLLALPVESHFAQVL